MKRLLLTILILSLLVIPVTATDISAPDAPDSAEQYLPDQSSSFGADLWYVIKAAVQDILPSISETAGICFSIIAVVTLTTILQGFSGHSKKVTMIVSAVGIGVLLFESTNTLIRLGNATVTELAEYGKLLLPVMTAAMAAQGGLNTSSALYMGTAVFNSVLTTLITKLIIPVIYIYICLCIADCATQDRSLKNLRDFVKWLATWNLKIILYVFTGYMGITGVVSGSVDAAAVKAAKLTISSAVPVVGNILSDASETILVSAGLMKNAAGIYGILAMIAIFIGPFLKIGIQYLLLKLTAGIISILDTQETITLVKDFSGALGMVLAITGTVCLLLLISVVCFMRGVN